MHIRQATYSDIDSLMEVFEAARSIMRASGNMNQWSCNYPSRELVGSDIKAGTCMVLCEDSTIVGTMALIQGPDPTYFSIDGEWPDESPYYVIHRIAALMPGLNLSKVMLDWAFEYIAARGCDVIRIDTHRDNIIMKHVLDKYGFTPCGVIYLADGSPRDAYYKNIRSI